MVVTSLRHTFVAVHLILIYKTEYILLLTLNRLFHYLTNSKFKRELPSGRLFLLPCTKDFLLHFATEIAAYFYNKGTGKEILIHCKNNW